MLTYLWQVTASNGQVIPNSTAAVKTFTPTDNGSYEVRLQVSDGQGGHDLLVFTITVNNIAPQVALGPNVTGQEGATLELTAQVTDIASDTFTYAWLVTDSGGHAVATSNEATFQFLVPDGGPGISYNVRLTVTDDDSGQGTDTLIVVATNAVPVVNLGPDSTGTEGTAIVLNGTEFVTDVAADKAKATYLWTVVSDNGQTIPAGHTAAFTFTPDDEGTYTVTLQVDDGDGGVHSDQRTIVVANVPPAPIRRPRA